MSTVWFVTTPAETRCQQQQRSTQRLNQAPILPVPSYLRCGSQQALLPVGCLEGQRVGRAQRIAQRLPACNMARLKWETVMLLQVRGHVCVSGGKPCRPSALP